MAFYINSVVAFQRLKGLITKLITWEKPLANRPRPTTQTTGTRTIGLKNLDNNHEGTIRKQNENNNIYGPRINNAWDRIPSQVPPCPTKSKEDVDDGRNHQRPLNSSHGVDKPLHVMTSKLSREVQPVKICQKGQWMTMD